MNILHRNDYVPSWADSPRKSYERHLERKQREQGRDSRRDWAIEINKLRAGKRHD